MSKAPAGRAGKAGALGALVLLASSAMTPGCYTTQLGLLRSGLDSLRAQVDTMRAEDQVMARLLADTRRDVGEQRDLLLGSQARQAATQQELADLMSRLDGRLDEMTSRVTRVSERAGAAPRTAAPPSADGGGTTAPGGAAGSAGSPSAPATPVGPSPSQVFDLATRDLTEGRYPLALQGYRDFLVRFGDTELADNAQYGVGECFFAQAAFDSAAVEYAKVGERWPQGDRAPAALYKLALSQERLGRTADAKRSFEDLVKRFPASSEAGLARDRIGATRR